MVGNQDNNPTNTNAPRGIDGIYLRPMKNLQGGHEIMNLATGQKIERAHVYERPMSDFVIQAVEKMAEDQGIKSLKLFKKNKQPLFPNDWTAGVDYESTNDENILDAEGNYVEIDRDDEQQIHNAVDEYEYDDELLDEQEYEQMDQNEINDLVADEGEQFDPTIENNNEFDADAEEIEAEAVEEHPDDESQEEAEEVAEPTRTRPTRAPKPIDWLTYTHHQMQEPRRNKSVTYDFNTWYRIEVCHNLLKQACDYPEDVQEYDTKMAPVVAFIMSEMNTRATSKGACFGPQYLLKKGLEKFGERGVKANEKELRQLHDRTCFEPVSIAEMTPDEKKKAVEALMFLTEKRDKSIKSRLVYNGKPTRSWLSKEDTSSPTVTMEGIFLTAIIDAKEGRDVLSADIPNAFIQTPMPEAEVGERVIMKITGVLVDLLVEIAPETYGPYVVFESGKKVLYVKLLKAMYGQLIASLLWYKKFRGDLENIGYEFNPYDPCVANKIINGKQHTVKYHVDDLMGSHVDPKVNDNFLKWLNELYGHFGEVKATRGAVHDYLGMTFDFSEEGIVKIDMIDYVRGMLDDFPYKLGPKDVSPTPAAENLFAAGTGPDLSKEKAQEFHTFVAKALFACKRARPDIGTATIAMTTRVQKPKEDDWGRLVRMMRYLNGTKNDKLILSADDVHVIKWYVDASFAVHPDFRSHTGSVMTYGKGVPISQSHKQKLNTRSSTEAEVVGVDDAMSPILWTRLFLEAQGIEVRRNILYQDNKSAILLENNGKKSSSKRTRAMNIRYFFVTDQISKGNLEVEYCPTEEMIGDFMTKPLQGKLFEKFRKLIMGHE